MPDYSYIYKTKFRKMGKWNLLPLDSNGNWHSEETSKYFKKVFGFGKGTFIIQTLDDDIQHAYFPQFYIDKVYNFIRTANQQDYKKFARIIGGFYKLRRLAQKAIPKTGKIDFKKLSNRRLIKVFKYNRDWAHRVAVYDQFGWIAEDYWTPIMEQILTKLGLKKGSDEYLRVLFVLTKPQEISTTLIEKRAVLEQAIKIKEKKTNLNSASVHLAKIYGWMPVFTYGTPWDKNHYREELREIFSRSINNLKKEYSKLIRYTQTRNEDIRDVTKKYRLKPQDLQKFVDFGLALDARNEAEYLVSRAGFYLLPIYDEIARRLFVSVKQLRNLVKKEVIACLEGKKQALDILQNQDKIIGWVFDRSMTHMKYLSSNEAQRFFDYLNKKATGLQGNDESVGLCASPGKVKGTAKIIFYPDEGNKVKSGNILITHATTVDFLPPMKRAAAFVTEIGGLTCHAAVVAREFGVPCVVGLKNATKNFKDEDLVEVDANKGIVRLVSSKKFENESRQVRKIKK